MAEVTLQEVPRLRPGFRFQWEPAQGCHVLLYPEGMVRLNDSASAILGLVDGQRSVADIVTALEQRFPDAGSLAADISEFLREAQQQHWVMLS